MIKVLVRLDGSDRLPSRSRNAVRALVLLPLHLAWRLARDWLNLTSLAYVHAHLRYVGTHCQVGSLARVKDTAPAMTTTGLVLATTQAPSSSLRDHPRCSNSIGDPELARCQTVSADSSQLEPVLVDAPHQLTLAELSSSPSGARFLHLYAATSIGGTETETASPSPDLPQPVLFSSLCGELGNST